MTYKMAIPDGSAIAEPSCFLPVSETWRHVLYGLVERALWDNYWDGTEEEVEAANAEVSLWLQKLGECTAMPQVAIASQQVSSGSYGGGTYATSWMSRTVNTLDVSQDWCEIVSSLVSLEPGVYHVHATAVIVNAGMSVLRLNNYAHNNVLGYGIPVWAGSVTAPVGIQNSLDCVFDWPDNHQIALYSYCTSAQDTYGLGYPVSITNVNERYVELVITRLGDAGSL